MAPEPGSAPSAPSATVAQRTLSLQCPALVRALMRLVDRFFLASSIPLASLVSLVFTISSGCLASDTFKSLASCRNQELRRELPHKACSSSSSVVMFSCSEPAISASCFFTTPLGASSKTCCTASGSPVRAAARKASGHMAALRHTSSATLSTSASSPSGRKSAQDRR